MSNTIRLFDTVKLGNTTLDNRMGVAPMTRTSATPEGLATDQMVSYYTKFARGGFGVIITEGIYPDGKYGQGYFNQPGLINNEQMQAWKKVTDSVHQAGGKIFAQLMHAGALSQGNRFVTDTIGPSVVQPKGEQMKIYAGKGLFPLPKEATNEDITDVIKGFVNAAKHAKEAGFDGVEIHGANGYILDQFLTDYVNQRTDEYGGSTENRVRLLVEAVKAVRKAVGKDYTLGIRISQGKINDFHHKWAGKGKDAEIIFGQLGSSGIDYIHVTEYEAWQPAFPEGEGTSALDSAFDDQGATLAALAKRYGKVPVIANGNLHDPIQANELIEKGEADVITIGRGALANGDWVNKVKNGESLEEFDPEKVLSPDAKIKDFEA
ncbi:NADH:flavin oxidoreductase [Peribacillus psychrosaccharolyticus]|uniref:NADH:flavin oxidoreductase n=1 Tax=Peribacillus psychrosaccharolyticus TaxID=1407 RepID=A0A974NP40_PERPY|nr:NADH:flavin oxidoreductase [Peribacillus psychrosaccharolyticus]MEC2054120.1 NADH:flavin oxidoreductase [Peribacillus psychrosaccharolyticus]MED3742259.1 NADH:flavin oxidoreductase [Peribacillus psychrosaccharolyticus]QQT01244.1 NADH:flavin oxidoreductase [Peribacillus psychrosaccharolyticus]